MKGSGYKVDFVKFREPVHSFPALFQRQPVKSELLIRPDNLLHCVVNLCQSGGHLLPAVILFTAEKATQMALDAIQLLGGNGYTNEYTTGRLLRDAKLYEIGAGTSEVRRMFIGRELFNDTK